MNKQENANCRTPDGEATQQARRTSQGICGIPLLEEENRRFADSPGISINNRGSGFLPAFKNSLSGYSVVSRFADGCPAPIHIIDGLPDEWLEGRDINGEAIGIRPHIISGFLRNGRFYTREEVSLAVLNQDDEWIQYGS
jgi:hypothetical protein